jgi:hypothetical protein
MIGSLKHAISIFIFALALGACTAAKLEARLEADPQCKPIINSKTGSLMPCPGTDKGFYTSVGLIPAKDDIKPSPSEAPKAQDIGTQNASAPSQNQSVPGCKPQLHKKTGTVLPCPAD